MDTPIGGPYRLQHASVGRMGGEPVGQGLGRGLHTADGRNRRVDVEPPPVGGEPAAHGEQRRTGVDRKPSRTGRHAHRFTEEGNRHVGSGQITLTEQPDYPSLSNPGGQLFQR